MAASLQSGSHEPVFWVSYLLLLCVYLAPLFVTPLLPGLDLPYHLSIADLLAKSGRPDSPYAPFYEGSLSLAPYVAHYALLVGLSKGMSLIAAHTVVMIAYVAGFPAATAALLRACGRSPLPALFAFPLAYNVALQYGFISFALGVPVVFWLLAVTAKLLGRPHLSSPLPWGSWLSMAALSLLLFLLHLQPFVFGVCAAFVFVAFAGPLSLPRLRLRLFASSAFVPVLVVVAMWRARRSFIGDYQQEQISADGVWSHVISARKLELALHGTIGRDLWVHITGMPHHLLRGFMDSSHVAGAQVILWTMLLYVALGAMGLSFRRPPVPRLHFRVAGLIVFAGAAAAFLALPHHVPHFGLTTLSPRYSVLAAVTLVLLVPASLLRFERRWALAVALPALVVCGWYGRTLVKQYAAYGAEVADFHHVLEKTPPGGRALGLVFDRHSSVMANESAFMGLPSFYPAKANHPKSMVAIGYCRMRHMPCQAKEPLLVFVPYSPTELQPEISVPFYDYFFVKSQPSKKQLFGAFSDRLEVLVQRGEWIVYRKKPVPP